MDQDPTFHADADRDPDPKYFLARGRKKISSKSKFYFAIIFQNLSCVIFSVTMREEGRGVRDKV